MKQIPLRVPDELIAKIDARVAEANTHRAGDQKFSRNDWLLRALEWALTQPLTTRTTKEQI